jgi:PAS domain S-box-containing protein
VLGTFALYGRAPGRPTEAHRRLIAVATHLAGVALARARAEEARARSERHFRALVEHSSDMIAVLTADGVYQYAGPAHARYVGYTPDDLAGHRLLDFVHAADRAAARDALAAVRADGGTVAFQARHRHVDGGWRTVSSIATNLLGEPAVSGLVVNSQDITEQRALEAQLRQAQKIEAVGQLAGGVAHDFNNLLMVITAATRFAREALPAAAPAHEDLAAVEAAAARAVQLTRQLLAFSRKQLLRPELLDPNRVVHGVLPMLRRLIGEDITIVALPAPGVRPVFADPGQLEQVLVNLALNARDAMPGGGRLVIETADVALSPAEAERRGGAAPGPYVRLRVRDSGIGMDAATLAQIFEPFFTTKAPGKGTGLGLSTVYGIVKQSGGWVGVASAPGEGTTFEVDLPAAAPDAAVAAAAGPAAAPPPRGSDTVLLVEDEAAVRSLVRRILDRHGYRVLEAANGAEALALADRHAGAVDLVLTDVVMPEMSGRAFAEALVARHPGARVLFMSGYTDDEILRRGIPVPGMAFLGKPFTVERLLTAVRDVLGAPR